MSSISQRRLSIPAAIAGDPPDVDGVADDIGGAFLTLWAFRHWSPPSLCVGTSQEAPHDCKHDQYQRAGGTSFRLLRAVQQPIGNGLLALGSLGHGVLSSVNPRGTSHEKAAA